MLKYTVNIVLDKVFSKRVELLSCSGGLPDEGARHHHYGLHPEGGVHQIEALQVLAEPPVNHLVAALEGHAEVRGGGPFRGHQSYI